MKDMALAGQGSSTFSGRRRSRTQKEEPETVSDVEDENEEDDPAEMVEPDEEDMDEDEAEDDGDGLTERYKQALHDGSTGNQEDPSFARYLLASNMGA